MVLYYSILLSASILAAILMGGILITFYWRLSCTVLHMLNVVVCEEGPSINTMEMESRSANSLEKADCGDKTNQIPTAALNITIPSYAHNNYLSWFICFYSFSIIWSSFVYVWFWTLTWHTLHHIMLYHNILKHTALIYLQVILPLVYKVTHGSIFDLFCMYMIYYTCLDMLLYYISRLLLCFVCLSGVCFTGVAGFAGRTIGSTVFVCIIFIIYIRLLYYNTVSILRQCGSYWWFIFKASLRVSMLHFISWTVCRGITLSIIIYFDWASLYILVNTCRRL